MKKVPQEALPPLYAAVGELVTNWAVIEMALGYWIACIYHLAGGKHLQSEINMAIGRKMKFLRLCFKKISRLDPYASDGIALLNRIENIKDTRHMVVHGCVRSYDEKEHTFQFCRLDLDKTKTMQLVKNLDFPVRKILDDSGEAMRIGSSALNFAERLLEAFITEDKRQNLFPPIRT